MYITRYLEPVIKEIHRTFKVLYVGGSRQVGKTTLLKHLCGSHGMEYVSLDDVALRAAAKKDPALFLQKYPAPLFIDEVQYAPELFPYIKLKVDGDAKKGQYWLSGSQQFSIMENVRESLAGRVGIVSLLGLSLAEISHRRREKNPFVPSSSRKATPLKLDVNTVFEHVIRGSFPALYDDNAPSPENFYNSYIQTYLDRDVSDIFGISKMSEFHRFLELAAARTGQILNVSDLARDAGVSVTAVREWISILETTMQIHLLRPYYANASKRLVKSPKLYFLDTGLAAHLSKWTSAETLRDSPVAGAFFETFVVSEILKSYHFRGIRPPLYFYRDKEKHEVDVLIEKNRLLHPVEIKMASHIKSADAQHIFYLKKKLRNIAHGAVIGFPLHSGALDREIEIASVDAIS